MLYQIFLEVCCVAVLLCNVQRNIFQNRFGNDVVLNERPNRQQKLSSRETEIKFSTRPLAQRRSQVRADLTWQLLEPIMVFIRSLFNSLPLLILMAGSCCSVCVEVPSDNLAVQGTNMKLACISCMKREEVSAETEVEWFYTSPEGENITMCSYYNGVQREVCLYKHRLIWNGSKDFQDVSVSLINVTLNDTGRYTCRIRRYLNYEIHSHTTKDEKYIDLLVTEEAGEDFTAVISEIMMYVLLVFLTLWLLIEMVYCYIKISRADEVAQDSATDYLTIPSENKENPAAQVGN